MDLELLDVLADLMGPQTSIDLAKGLLAVQSLGTQQVIQPQPLTPNSNPNPNPSPHP